MGGGSWYADTGWLRCAARGGDDPSHRSGEIGFRFVSEPDPLTIQMCVHYGGNVDCYNLSGCAVTFEFSMVLVPAGTFIMGSPVGELGRNNDEVQHQVTLTHPLCVSKYEVTQAEWQLIMGWNTSFFQAPSNPVEDVTWFDCISYCNQRSAAENLQSVYTMTGPTYNGVHITSAASVTCAWTRNGYRLLTEAEWEYTCRATSTTAFCNGPITNTICSDPLLDLVGWYCTTATHNGGLKLANNWDLHDMHGNLWEWGWDWYGGVYGSGPVTDPTGPPNPTVGPLRILRGGAWDATFGARYCRSAYRYFGEPGYAGQWVGLRVAKAAP